MICNILQSLMITRQFLTARNTKKLIRVIWNASNRVRFHPCLIKLALIKFTLCYCYYVFLIWKGKTHTAVSLTLILWRWKKPRWSEYIFILSLMILPYSVRNKVEHTTVLQAVKQTFLFSTKCHVKVWTIIFFSFWIYHGIFETNRETVRFVSKPWIPPQNRGTWQVYCTVR